MPFSEVCLVAELLDVGMQFVDDLLDKQFLVTDHISVRLQYFLGIVVQ